MKYDLFISDFDGTLVRRTEPSRSTPKRSSQNTELGAAFHHLHGAHGPSILPRARELGITSGPVIALSGLRRLRYGHGTSALIGAFPSASGAPAHPHAGGGEPAHPHLYAVAPSIQHPRRDACPLRKSVPASAAKCPTARFRSLQNERSPISSRCSSWCTPKSGKRCASGSLKASGRNIM